MVSRASNESEAPRIESTLAPVRNFTIRLDDRIRAAGGPPAYMRRKRHIEDLEDTFVRILRELEAKLAGKAPSAEVREAVRAAAAKKIDLREINRLVALHNRYYVAEANLPIDAVTEQVMERGAPWRPLDLYTLDALMARAFPG